MQGLTYGIFYATMVTYANKVSPPGTNATVQGIVQSAFIGVGKFMFVSSADLLLLLK